MNMNTTIANFMAQAFDAGFIDDDTNIIIKDYVNLEELACGHWYNDNILSWIVKKTPKVRSYRIEEYYTGNPGIDRTNGKYLYIEVAL